LSGYGIQCQKVQQNLEKLIDKKMESNNTLIIEGVHLDPPFIQKMVAKYPNKCLPFLICVKNSKNHQERFAVRSKKMTVDPAQNKYIKNYQAIKSIQDYLIESAK
jgi:2-phosphoglycerate kinase